MSGKVTIVISVLPRHVMEGYNNVYLLYLAVLHQFFIAMSDKFVVVFFVIAVLPRHVRYGY